jgi:hypothetical protein
MNRAREREWWIVLSGPYGVCDKGIDYWRQLSIRLGGARRSESSKELYTLLKITEA